MNPEEESFDDIIKYNLEPVIYSFRILEDFIQTASMYCQDGEKMKIHIEMDTGMHRLGFMESDITQLTDKLNENNIIEVQSIFSHLACSEDAEMDAFTQSQIDKFEQWSGRIKSALKNNTDILCHILNSSGIVRFTHAEMDMVRLGIGLYGVSPHPEVQKHLTLISRLKTKISQLKYIPQGDSVGYNCSWVAQRDSKIAIIPIGYADGLSRKMGNGVGKVSINGNVVPLVGKVCMDMCFIDVTDIEWCKKYKLPLTEWTTNHNVEKGTIELDLSSYLDSIDVDLVENTVLRVELKKDILVEKYILIESIVFTAENVDLQTEKL